MSPPAEQFLTTRWTHVLAAQGASTEAGTALAELCAAYYTPVHAYIEKTSRDLGDARDLTQEFFARLLAGRMLTGAERGKGSFRGYLLGAVKHFLADSRDRRNAVKRGAQHEHLPIGQESDTSPGLEISAAAAGMVDAVFDRHWGLAVLDRALTGLAAEHKAQGKSAQFEHLKTWLTGDACGVPQAEMAAQLGCSEGAVKVAIHRLRKRFRDLVKAEIMQTVSTEDECREELRYLIEVVA